MVKDKRLQVLYVVARLVNVGSIKRSVPVETSQPLGVRGLAAALFTPVLRGAGHLRIEASSDVASKLHKNA